MIGQTILHYKIIEKLGEGGMGVVYKAEDTRLERTVALKFLSLASIGDEEKKRFKREAKAAASLNHPNITTIFAIDEADDQTFIAMEYIEGQSLQEIVGDGHARPLPLDKAIDYAIQTAAGLQAAHEKGITHRDIKSANIMVTDKGQIKIMDFGLAKLANRSKLTQLGTTLGTAAYMSPEQSRGENTDHRADIWSLGVVLYEMISGQMPFKGDYEQAVIYSIQNEEPEPLTALRSGVPIALDGIIAKALAKDPKTRYQHVDELPADLKALDTAALSQSRISVVQQPSEGSKPSEGSRLPWLVAAVMAIGFALTLFLQQRNTASQVTERLNISVLNSPEQQVFRTDFPALAISPDGAQLAYSITENGVTQLYIRSMNSFEATPIKGTDNASAPFFSPDGQWIGFLADGKLKRVAAAGGAPETICDTPSFRGASWGPDDTIIFSPEYATGLMSVRSSGGETQVVSRLDTARHERTHRWPQVLPGGEWVLYTIGDENNSSSYINAELAIQSTKTGERHILNVRGEMARYVEPGYLIIARNGVLLAAPFSLEKFETTEAPQLVVSNVAGNPGSGVSYFDLSRSGKLVLIPGNPNEELELVWVDHKGQVEPLPLPKKSYSTPRVSPDGKKIAVTIGQAYGANSDIWIYDLTSEVFSRFTFEQGMWSPVWSRDSKDLYFTSGVVGKRGVMVKPVDGSREELIIPAGSFGTIIPASISPDGTQLSLNFLSGPTEGDVFIFNLNKKDQPIPLFESNNAEYFGNISSNGKFIAYTTTETGRFEVFINTYPDLTGKWQVSTDGGRVPRWSRDGRELYYSTYQKKMVSVAIQTQPVFSLGRSIELFDLTQMYLPNIGTANYDISPDGQRFLMIRNTSFNSSATAFNVILNWVEELESRFAKNE